MQASRLMEQEGVEGWEEKMSRRRADLASAVCKELPVFKKKMLSYCFDRFCFPQRLGIPIELFVSTLF